MGVLYWLDSTSHLILQLLRTKDVGEIIFQIPETNQSTDGPIQWQSRVAYNKKEIRPYTRQHKLRGLGRRGNQEGRGSGGCRTHDSKTPTDRPMDRQKEWLIESRSPWLKFWQFWLFWAIQDPWMDPPRDPHSHLSYCTTPSALDQLNNNTIFFPEWNWCWQNPKNSRFG